jgi:UDP-N-acetylmuramate dehydrogenase
MPRLQISPQKDVLLSHLSTIGLGGKAMYFVSCESVEEILGTLAFAKERHLRVQVIGGGSNIIFPDEGFDGLVIRVAMKGISLLESGGWTTVTAKAGEPWDEFVKRCIENGLGGIECLSGIPGLVGATPIQNVGAYGQEVAETIISLRALERATLQTIEFAGQECGFGYRQSRFKGHDADRYIITEVTFRMRTNGRPVIRYPELRKYLESSTDVAKLASGRQALEAVQTAVLALRRRKSMVLDPADPNTRSVGSFFMNPILSKEALEKFHHLWKTAGDGSTMVTFPSESGVKIPAGWLVEKAGFKKGYRRAGVGISSNHSLALINCGGTTRELLALAEEIQHTVFAKFGIRLEREPVVVQ